MNITKEKLDIDGVLEKRIKNTLKFLNIKAKIIKGNIISISKTNLAYIEPHKFIIDNTTYLFFNECSDIYINTLEQSIPLSELEKHIKRLQVNYPIDYQEIQKEKYNDHQFCLKYTRENIYNEPLKMIPIINKKGLNKVDKFGIIEVPVPPITYIYADKIGSEN